MRAPLVSVIVPAFNQATYLGEALQSVLDQSYEDLEVIVVDDGSRDRTPEVVNLIPDPRIRYIAHPRNMGSSAARNTGLNAAAGEIIAFLDADDRFHPDKLQSHVSFLQRHPDVGVSYGARFETDSAGNYLSIWRPPSSVALPDLVIGFPFNPSDMVLRKEWALRVGLLDESFTLYGDDLAFNCRLALAGCRFRGIDRALTYRRYYPGKTVKDPAAACAAIVRALEMVFSHPSCPQEVLRLRGRALGNSYMAWAYEAMAGNDTALGQDLLRQAIELDPDLVGDGQLRLLHFLLHRTTQDGGDHDQQLSRVFAQLADEMQWLSSQRDWAIGRGYLIRGARAALWQQSDLADLCSRRAREMGAHPDEPFLRFVLDQLTSFEAEMGRSAAKAALERLAHLLSRVGSDTDTYWLTSRYNTRRTVDQMDQEGTLLTDNAFNRNLLQKAWWSFAHKGPLGLARDARDYLRWRLTQPTAGAQPVAPTPQSNWDLNQAELQTLPDVLRSKPVLVYAESTSRCNLHCFMCRLSFPETTRQTRDHMKLETFARLEPLLEPGSRLSLFGLGEPLLNPNFVEMLRIAKTQGSFVGLNSNAMLLTERIAQAMVDLEQDLLVVSFSGGTKETYERVITGANYERVVGNLRRLNELKRQSANKRRPSATGTQGLGSLTPIEQITPVLQLQFTAMRENFHEIPEVVRLALELRCAGVIVMPLTIVDPSLAEQSLLNPELWPQVEKAFAEARAVADAATYPFDLQLPTIGLLRAMKRKENGTVGKRDGADDPNTQQEEPTPSTDHSLPICYEPWQTFYARDDGTVNTCCYSNRALGDLKQQTALEIWNGDLYRRFRARMRSDNKPSECRVCHKLRGDDWYDQRVDEEAFYDEL